MPTDVNWEATVINVKEHDLLKLPDRPICKFLVKLVLHVPDLTVIPPTFFEEMSVLEVLDLSNTSILSLPASISKLKELQQLLLKDCSALMVLPTEVGMLSKLKLFDIEGTELMLLPEEMGSLTELEVLRVSLSQYAKYYIKRKTACERVIPKEMLLQLKQLKELCIIISVGSEPEWWEEEVTHLQEHLINLKKLQTLRWYLPTSKVLNEFLQLKNNSSPMYKSLSNFTLTIGQHAQLTSVLPRGLEKKFEEFKNCLKWINAEGNEDDISKVMACVKALFLSRHWTIEKLSTFNVPNLKYCLLSECNEMQTLVEVDEMGINNGEESGLELLQYLCIHHMMNLQSIWKGPIGKNNLSKLTILALHTCPHLTSIFSQIIAQNLSCLRELTIEDCPKLTSLIDNESQSIISSPFFPRLEKIFLLDLPELSNIFVGGTNYKLKKIRTMLVYGCLKLRDLSKMDVPLMENIEGETEWWNGLGDDKPQGKYQFLPLKKGRDLIDQLFEATNSLEHFHDILSQGKISFKTEFI